MPEITTTIAVKSKDFLDLLVRKEKAKTLGEAVDFLVNQQLKRRGTDYLRSPRPPAAKPMKRSSKKSDSGSKKTTTPKQTGRLNPSSESERKSTSATVGIQESPLK